jgi:hypothetical protein
MVISIVTIIGCNKKSNDLQVDNQNKLSDKEILSLFAKIGSQHNAALSNVLNKLKTLKNSKSPQGLLQQRNTNAQTELETYETIISSVTDDAIVNFNYLSPDSLYTTDQIKTYVFGYNFGQIDSIYNHKWNEGITISPTLDNLVNQIEAIIQSSTTKEETIASLQSLLDNNLSSLTDQNEKMGFVGAIEIGKSSAEYWYSNISDWTATYPDFGQRDNPFNGLAARQTSGQIIKDAVLDDIKGGLGGIVRGAIKGVVFGVQSAAASALYHGFVYGVSASAGSGEGSPFLVQFKSRIFSSL